MSNIKDIASDYMADRKIGQHEQEALSVVFGYMTKEVADLWDTMDNDGVDNMAVLAEIRAKEADLANFYNI